MTFTVTLLKKTLITWPYFDNEPRFKRGSIIPTVLTSPLLLKEGLGPSKTWVTWGATKPFARKEG